MLSTLGEMRIVATVTLLLSLVAADVATAAPRARLKAFDSCKDLVGYARDGALRTRGGVGVVGPGGPVAARSRSRRRRCGRCRRRWTRTAGSADARRAGLGSQAARGCGGSVPDFSGTNTQEADVDEPDVVKTDGRRIVVVTDGTLRVIAPDGGVTGTLALDGVDHRLLLRGDRVLAISTKGASAETIVGRPIAPEVAPQASVTVVTEIDISAAPKVLRTMDVEGRFIDARQNGAVARLVIDSVPEPIIPRRRRHAAVGGQEGRRERASSAARRSRATSPAAPSSATSRRVTPSRARRSSPASTCSRS